MRKRPIYLLMIFLGVSVIHLVSIIYVKRTSFPFITMFYTNNIRDFNSGDFNFRVKISDRFKSRVVTDLAFVSKSDDIFYIASTLGKYVRSHLFEQNNTVRNVESILDSDGEDAAICSGYSKLLVAVASSLGYDSRVIWMNGHTASEIYFPEYGWVLVDTNGNLMFKDDKGNYVSLLYVVDNFDKTVPVRLTEPTDNDPDYLSSDSYLVYNKNSIIVVIEGQRLFDFDQRTKSPILLLKYFLFNEPIARGIQYTGGGRTKLGNLRKFAFWICILDFIIVFLGLTYFIKYLRKKRRIYIFRKEWISNC